ncbi:type II secretion system minor pseudopilin GspI [Acinetobacter junii]|uniref:type II secretion system minor pseudopilin GspI n=1 Tax=Acinetobacter junii TaxID=40215 RepID=UPI0024B68673|nr:type II secretion system minor pseudopilin GspI [Acinetobacter junii]MDI9722054.1 type II secretion system minor pseudopilin GspI [Acinetobacter junii]
MTNRQFSLLDKKTDSLNFQTIAEVKLHSLKIQKGFTLLEVMVALAIFAVAAIALTKIAMQYTQSTSNAILRTKAQFVAMNEIATMEINQEWLEGIQSKQVTAQGETWQIDKKAQSTLSPKIQRIELQVSLYNIEQGKVEAGITNLVFFNYPAKVKTS